MFRMQMKRRKEQRTNYRRRMRLLFGRQSRIVIRKSSSGFSIQLVKYRESGDETLLEVNTKHLCQHGWKAHGGSVPSAYLTGFLFGKIAAKKGFGSGVVDVGMQSGSSQTLIAAARGLKDAGLDIPLGAQVSEERIRGKIIADYAKQLKEGDVEAYRKQFSSYLKGGFDPEKLAEHFEEVKRRIENL